MAECCYAASRFPNSLSRGTCKIKRADRNYSGFFLLSIRGTFVLVCEIDESALTELPLTFSLKETTQSPNLIIPIRLAGVTRATLIRRKRIFLTNAKNQGTPNSLRQIGQKCGYMCSASQNFTTRFDEFVRPYFDFWTYVNAQITSPHEFFRSYCKTRFDFRARSQRHRKRRSPFVSVKQVESLIVLLPRNRRAALFRWK